MVEERSETYLAQLGPRGFLLLLRLVGACPVTS